MRINLDIDDDLMASALEAGGYKTEKEAVEAGLKLLARKRVYRELLELRGKLHWEGDLRAERQDIRDEDLIDPDGR